MCRLQSLYSYVGSSLFVSSLPTDVVKIFFPRSFTHEAGYQAKVHTPQTSREITNINSPTHLAGPHTSKQPIAMEYPVTPTHQSIHTFRFSDHTSPEVMLHSPRSSSSRLPEFRQFLDSALSSDYDTGTESEAVTVPAAPLRMAEQHQPGPPSRIDPRWEGRGITSSSTDYVWVQHSVRATTSLPPRPRQNSREVRSSLQLHPYVSSSIRCLYLLLILTLEGSTFHFSN